jgi:hypothetical protein
VSNYKAIRGNVGNPTPWEVNDINASRDVSRAVERITKGKQFDPQAAIARLERDMGQRKVNEIWREVMAVYADPDVTKRQPTPKILTCCVCGAEFEPWHSQQRTCGPICSKAHNNALKCGKAARRG